MIEKRGERWRVIAKWAGFPRFSQTVGGSEDDAKAYDRMLEDLRDAGRRDILQNIKDGHLDIFDVYQAMYTGLKSSKAATPARKLILESLLGTSEAPQYALGDLVAEWTEWLGRKGTISPRLKRTYSPRTIRRYTESWDSIFRHIEGGRSAPLSRLTRSALDVVRDARLEEGASHSTVNRDMTAVDSFCRWLADHRDHIAFARPRLVKGREPEQQERYLDAKQIHAVRAKADSAWWPLFELMLYTGLRISEAQALQRRDIQLERGLIRVEERDGHRLKSRTSARAVPIPEPLVPTLKSLLAHRATRAAYLFADAQLNYDHAYNAFEAACIAAGLHDDGAAHRRLLERQLEEDSALTVAERRRRVIALRAREDLRKKADFSLHSLRHTYGVTCARAGLPATEIRDLMGHSSISVTERYMKYRPDADRSYAQAAAIAHTLAIHSTQRGTKPPARRVKRSHSPTIPQIKDRVGGTIARRAAR